MMFGENDVCSQFNSFAVIFQVVAVCSRPSRPWKKWKPTMYKFHEKIQEAPNISLASKKSDGSDAMHCQTLTCQKSDTMIMDGVPRRSRIFIQSEFS